MLSTKLGANEAGYYYQDYDATLRDEKRQISMANALTTLSRRLPKGGSLDLARTASTLSAAGELSAPFELDMDRSKLVDNEWNKWLAVEAANITVALLRGDWFERFGADAYRALERSGEANPSDFLSEVERLLADEACWPTKANGNDRFAKASLCVLPLEPLLGGFMADQRYFDPLIMKDDEAKRLWSGKVFFVPPVSLQARCTRPSSFCSFGLLAPQWWQLVPLLISSLERQFRARAGLTITYVARSAIWQALRQAGHAG